MCFGFKLWRLNTPSGYLDHTEHYQGQGPEPVFPGLGMGGSVVMDLLSLLEENHYHVYFDNLFTSLPLLDALQNKKIKGTKSLRANRTSGCLLENSQCGGKRRGKEYHKLDANTNIILVRCNDNSVMTAASTGFGVTTLCKATR